ncbi:6-pyruvoyl tetrahydropterin synthase [Caloranaerobacter azorensis H53214]|uniref:6-carboxy-5,6,7,8-tetrahydropterin synthase n=2 Tax=Caloranaerobacter azorensis TaxID=116090 RepID=A0A096BKW3_9FIRM|nr:6-pyruvoyl tetrahydropterin synthase [Caloranaerobacter azorensis H53214]QIB28144.1 6-carboxytetrahydropterin synthase QueD [Caloranaerobacter azorensis]
MDITKIFTFDSAHKLEDYDGECRFLHGHTYKLEITIRGEVDNRGIVIDFNELKEIVKEKVINVLDHKYLNEIFDFNPTCENILFWIFNEIDNAIKKDNCWLKKVVLWETPTSYATLER